MVKSRRITDAVAHELHEIGADLQSNLRQNAQEIRSIESRMKKANMGITILLDLENERSQLIQFERDLLVEIAATTLLSASNIYLSKLSLTHDESRIAHENFLVSDEGFMNATAIVNGLNRSLPYIHTLPATHRVVLKAREALKYLFR